MKLKKAEKSKELREQVVTSIFYDKFARESFIFISIHNYTRHFYCYSDVVGYVSIADFGTASTCLIRTSRVKYYR